MQERAHRFLLEVSEQPGEVAGAAVVHRLTHLAHRPACARVDNHCGRPTGVAGTAPLQREVGADARSPAGEAAPRAGSLNTELEYIPSDHDLIGVGPIHVVLLL